MDRTKHYDNIKSYYVLVKIMEDQRKIINQKPKKYDIGFYIGKHK
jgi:hypothetical protein